MPRVFRPSKAEFAAVLFIVLGFIAVLALSMDGAATPPASPTVTPLATAGPSPQQMETMVAEWWVHLTAIAPTATAAPPPGPEIYTGILLGTDYDPQYPERNSFGIRTDVFVIASMVTYPAEWDAPARLVLFALPRDLWLPIACADVELPGEYAWVQPLEQVPPEAFDRINAAWYRGGVDCVRETVRYNFGVDVDGPVLLTTMPAFIAVVDALGGLDIRPGLDYTDFCGTYNGTDGTGGDWRTWNASQTYHMQGNELLCYVRARQNPVGDLDRNRRELEVIKAMKAQWAPGLLLDRLSLADYIGLLNWARQYIEWDGPTGEFIHELWRLDEPSSAVVWTASLGTERTDFWRTPGGASVVVPAFPLEGYPVDFDQSDALAEWFGCVLWQC